jgi:hypothetical protein
MEIREHIQRQHCEGIDMAKKVRDVTKDRPVVDVDDVMKEKSMDVFNEVISRMDTMISELRAVSEDLHKLKESLA